LADTAPFALAPAEKAAYLAGQLDQLLEHHRAHCPPYAALVADWEQHGGDQRQGVEDYPFLPVSVFKEY
ncbi:MAG: acyl-protein synthetase, partial [Planctomycetales bacterium]|nr:acyl-protein synthetase [Planctomycetales bacterium]